MHIFNLNNKPYLIISTKELLFRHNSLDEQMQRIAFSDIKKVHIQHRYSPQKELFIWLSIQTTLKNTPYLVQVSLLNEPLEEIFTVLQNELQSKVKLNLPKKTKLTRLKTHNKTFKRLSFFGILLFLSLLIYHKFVLPPLESVQTDATKLSYQKTQGFCSSSLKVAYPSEQADSALVNDYCGLFGFWKLQSSKEVPLKYIQTEFESYTPRQRISTAIQLIKEEKYDKAVISLEKALYSEPNNQLAEVYLSKVYALQGDKNKALALAKKTVKKYESLPLAHENIAYLYLADNNLSAAYTHFQAFNRLDPTVKSYMALANIQEKQNLKDEALSNYEKALVLNPDDSDILTNMGLAYWEKQDFSKAEITLKKAYTLDPDFSGYFLNYYEITLVTDGSLTSEQKEKFLQAYQDDIEQMMVYDMLKIIEASIAGKDVDEAKANWKEKYHAYELDWSFIQIRAWLDDSRLEIEHMQDIQRTIGFFIGHQQAYAMKRNTTLLELQ